jgi:hypothetical protein
MKLLGNLFLWILMSAGIGIGWIIGGEQGEYVAIGLIVAVLVIAFFIDLSNSIKMERERNK